MISGRADCSDDWLPARIRPVRGESFDSLCRRLAAANGITPAVLLRGCMSKHPGVQTPIEAVARCIGVDPAALERLTAAELRRRWGGLQRRYGCAVIAALDVSRMLCSRAISNSFACLALRSWSRDLGDLRPLRPGACIGFGTDRTMSITALGCEGSHTNGRVGDGLVRPRRGHTTGID
jgi:hypothetical protein